MVALSVTIDMQQNKVERETLRFNLFFPPFYIGDGRIAGSMAVYHSTLFCY